MRNFPHLFLGLWEFFKIIIACWLLPNVFSTSVDLIMWFFFFSVLIWWNTLVDFSHINLALHPWDKFYLVMVQDFLIYWWILSSSINKCKVKITHIHVVSDHNRIKQEVNNRTITGNTPDIWKPSSTLPSNHGTLYCSNEGY